MQTDAGFSSTFQGQLQKYTNVVKGWCPRWFFLDPMAGTLDYYLADTEVSSKPRGTLQLIGAVVSPSEEDSHTFTVSSASGEFFKLRACDAKERQEWVNRLRAVGEHLDVGTTSSSTTSVRRPPAYRTTATSPWENYAASVFWPATNPAARVTDWANAHTEADQQLRLIGDLFDLVQRETDELPASGAVSSSNLDVLQLASTSLLTLHTLQDAIRLLENEAYRPSVLDQGKQFLRVFTTTFNNSNIN